MAKYKKYFRKMLDDNKKLFKSFQKIHSLYVLDPKTHQEKFNEKGKKVVEIIRQYEKKLCFHSEKGIYAKFSKNLAEKFQAEVRKIFPKIDFVGVKITKKKEKLDLFDSLRKITFK